MEFINTWQTFTAPNLALQISAVLAAVATFLMARPVIRVARKAGRFKPQSLILLVLPALMLVGGHVTDEVRELNYRDHVVASGAVDSGWAELEKSIEAQYNISGMEPFGDPIDVVNQSYIAAHGNDKGRAPLVKVQMPESTHVEVYHLVVEPTDLGVDVSLKQTASAVFFEEGIDPERLRINPEA